MTLSKMTELVDLSDDAIATEIEQLKRALFELRFKRATRQEVKPHEPKHLQHKLAQLMTLQHQRKAQA
jgi:large subunit ribosomal protein L29